MGGFVLLIQTEIVFKIGFSGYRCVHAASEENGLKYIVLLPASIMSCVNVGRMERVVIQY